MRTIFSHERCTIVAFTLGLWACGSADTGSHLGVEKQAQMVGEVTVTDEAVTEFTDAVLSCAGYPETEAPILMGEEQYQVFWERMETALHASPFNEVQFNLEILDENGGKTPVCRGVRVLINETQVQCEPFRLAAEKSEQGEPLYQVNNCFEDLPTQHVWPVQRPSEFALYYWPHVYDDAPYLTEELLIRVFGASFHIRQDTGALLAWLEDSYAQLHEGMSAALLLWHLGQNRPEDLPAIADLLVGAYTPAICPRGEGAGLRIAPGRMHTFSIDWDRLRRTYHVYVPNGAYDADKPLTVIYAFHGHGDNGRNFASLTKLNELAEQTREFIVVYVDAAGVPSNWNTAGGVIDHINSYDDVGFVKEVMRRVENEACADPNTKYGLGFSLGASFVQRLAEETDIFTAVAASSGVLVTNPMSRDERVPDPVPTTPILLFHGDQDETFPADRPPESVTSWLKALLTSAYTANYGLPSAEQNFRQWARYQARTETELGCALQEPLGWRDEGVFACRRFECGVDIAFCLVREAGHEWFSTEERHGGFDMTAEMWQFLKQYHHGGPLRVLP